MHRMMVFVAGAGQHRAAATDDPLLPANQQPTATGSPTSQSTETKNSSESYVNIPPANQPNGTHERKSYTAGALPPADKGMIRLGCAKRANQGDGGTVDLHCLGPAAARRRIYPFSSHPLQMVRIPYSGTCEPPNLETVIKLIGY